MDRALVSGTRGRAFESRIARHNNIKGLANILAPFYFVKNLHPPCHASGTMCSEILDIGVTQKTLTSRILLSIFPYIAMNKKHQRAVKG